MERASGDFLGWVHLRPEAEAPDDERELGYRLRRSAWGRGYAVEASRAATKVNSAAIGVTDHTRLIREQVHRLADEIQAIPA